jgi:hypothetical protein
VITAGETPTSYTATYSGGPATNLALDRPATADGQCAAGEGPAKAVNGSWAGGSADKWCSLGATKWLRVDLGAVASVSGFVVRHAGVGGEPSAWNTRDFTVEVSSDGLSWTTVVAVTGNTASVTSHVVAAGGRYVRLNVTVPTSDGNAAARIYELEVLGSRP